MKLLVATTNAGKVREFREMLGDGRFEWSDLKSVGASGKPVEAPDETGRTFRANATLKASYYAKHFQTWTLADDSGLEVDALNGSPGVFSSRWAELNRSGNGDADNNATLLRQIADVPDESRTGRFVCVLALSDPNGRIVLTARDTVEGRLLREPRGTNGFGYDPLFLLPELGKTTAELSSDEKHRISHRGKALRRVRELMKRAGLIGDFAD
ncbi:MAG: RdgB/HAM1 family non-canonical purine NTP pyrophosphatase [Tepidisphaeraceae bacterium]